MKSVEELALQSGALDEFALRYAIEHNLVTWVRVYLNDERTAYVEQPVCLPEAKGRSVQLLAAQRPCDGTGHGFRTPAVCCQTADVLGKPHPWNGPCPEKGCKEGTRCAREDCTTGRPRHAHDPKLVA